MKFQSIILVIQHTCNYYTPTGIIFETDISNFFTDIWPVADISMTTDTDIPKFAYSDILTKYFG